YSRGGDADDVLQVTGGPARQGDLVVHEGPDHAAQPGIAPAASVQVVDVPTVLAVHAYGHTRRPGGELAFEGGDVPGMDDARPALAEDAIDRGQDACRLARRLVERDELDIRRADPPGELRIRAGQREHAVAGERRRKAVQQVGEAVLEPAHAEAMDDVHDQRACVHGRHDAPRSARASSGTIPSRACSSRDRAAAFVRDAAPSPSAVQSTRTIERSPAPRATRHAVSSLARESLAVLRPSTT